MRPLGSPRALALRVVRRVVEGDAYSNLTLSAELGRSRLSARDRNLAADLAYGTLRRRLILDDAIARSSTRPLERIDPPILALLRLGAYQVLFTRIPSHAAVSETVQLADPGRRGFVNAVLRRLASAGPVVPEGAGDEAITARSGLASWAVAELRSVLPEEEVEPAAAALGTPAGLSLRVNLCRSDRRHVESALRARRFEVRRGRHSPEVLWVASAIPSLLPGYREGWFAVQDEASVLVAAAVGAVPGERVLDACAGPGGKTAHLACSVAPAGVVVAADVNPRRAALVRSTARRLGVRPRVVVQDARRPAMAGGFAAALVDAPCSGLGAARRRPELLWRPNRSELSSLARLQAAILLGVADLVGEGGRLVYAVCTFTRAETDAVVRAFLSKRPDFRPEEVAGPDGPAPTHRLWPHRHGTDAMFYAGFARAR